MPTCHLTCLPAYMPLPDCLHLCRPAVNLTAHLSNLLPMYLLACLTAFLPTCLPIYLPASLLACQYDDNISVDLPLIYFI